VPVLNRQAGLDGRRFDPAAPARTLGGRWGIGHYGVMIPGLPEPFRFFDAIVVLGAPRVPIFGAEALLRTTRRDAAWILTGTAALEDGFQHYSIAADCDLVEDDRHLRFADHLTIERRGREVRLQAARGDVTADLELLLTPAVSHFAHLPGIYDHWSVLARYQGSFTAGGRTEQLSGLCTYEHARAVNAALPFVTFFTYHVLNVSAATQVLMVELLGSRGIVIQRMVYVRDVDGNGTRHTRDFRHVVHAYAEEPLVTPDGFRMTMPQSFSWSVLDDDGSELVSIEGTANGDYRYGLGAGYAGSYHYTGVFRGEPIGGTAYHEWVDRR
jgi:hypothetical protein